MRLTLPTLLFSLSFSLSVGAINMDGAVAQVTPAQQPATGSAGAPAPNGATATSAATTTTTDSKPLTTGVTHVHQPDPTPPKNEPMWQAEAWVRNKNSPWLTAADSDVEKTKHKGPVRNFIKSVAKGTAKELGTSFDDMAKDMVLVFSVQDIDPYDMSKGPPTNRPAIVMKFTMVDGTSCYLRRFPDGSYAVEDGFANGTVLLPRKENGDYLVNYPNGVQGRMVKGLDGNIKIYRPDNTITTFTKNASGGYAANNTKFGYMGEARGDDTGVQWEVGAW